jgi:hypothetical protein
MPDMRDEREERCVHCSAMRPTTLVWPWIERANMSAIPAAIVDSLLFPTLAFGSFVFVTSFGLFVAKFAGAFVWSLVIRKFKPRKEAIA